MKDMFQPVNRNNVWTTTKTELLLKSQIAQSIAKKQVLNISQNEEKTFFSWLKPNGAARKRGCFLEVSFSEVGCSLLACCLLPAKKLPLQPATTSDVLTGSSASKKEIQ